MTSCSTVKGTERSFTQSNGDCCNFGNDPICLDDRALYFMSRKSSQDSEESRPLTSNRLDDIIQCSTQGRLYLPHSASISSSFTLNPRKLSLIDVFIFFLEGPKLCVLITSASYPFHVEWVSSDWSKKCGWSSDEILGTIFIALD
jgi:hypothetical protein